MTYSVSSFLLPVELEERSCQVLRCIEYFSVTRRRSESSTILDVSSIRRMLNNKSFRSFWTENYNFCVTCLSRGWIILNSARGKCHQDSEINYKKTISWEACISTAPPLLHSRVICGWSLSALVTWRRRPNSRGPPPPPPINSVTVLSVSSEVLCVAVGDGEGAARRQMLHQTQAPVLGEYLYALLNNLNIIYYVFTKPKSRFVFEELTVRIEKLKSASVLRKYTSSTVAITSEAVLTSPLNKKSETIIPKRQELKSVIIHDLNTNISVVYYYLSILSSIKYLEENNINHQVNPANYNIRSTYTKQ